MTQLCIDLYCGLGGWAEGFLAEGYDVIGFDVERHDYGTGGYPGQLVLQDVLTIHGSQFRNAACIVASPPCQEFSYMAMPWKRAKQIAKALRGGLPPSLRGGGRGDLATALSGHGAKPLGDLRGATFAAHHGGSIASGVNRPEAGIALDWVLNHERILVANDAGSTAPDVSCPNDFSGFQHDGIMPLSIMARQEEWNTFPEGYTGSRTVAQLTALFDACFRIQREASEAAGRYIPMVVENVKGAQPWVGRAKANYGSFYLWGDVESIGGRIVAAHQVRFGADSTRAYRAQKIEGYSDPRRNGGKGARLTCQAENDRRRIGCACGCRCCSTCGPVIEEEHRKFMERAASAQLR